MGGLRIIADRGLFVAVGRVDGLDFDGHDRQRPQIRVDLGEQEIHLERSRFTVGRGGLYADLPAISLPKDHNLTTIQPARAPSGLGGHVRDQVAIVAKRFAGDSADDGKLVSIKPVRADYHRRCGRRL